jgi:hypothetical protein
MLNKTLPARRWSFSHRSGTPPGPTVVIALVVRTLRHNIGDAGVYLAWQETRQVGGAFFALASRFLLPEGRVFLPR